MIPPSLQREMSERAGSTVVETTGSHSIYVSPPAVVADLIERAAPEVGSPAMAQSRAPPARRKQGQGGGPVSVEEGLLACREAGSAAGAGAATTASSGG